MKVYVWEAGFGFCHAVVIAESVEEARYKALMRYRQYQKLMSKAESCDPLDHLEYESQAAQICRGEMVDVSREPDYIMDEGAPALISLNNDSSWRLS